MTTVGVTSIDVTVTGAPQTVQLDTNIGPTGDRGSYSNYGIIEAAATTPGDLANGTREYFDTYTVVNPESANYLQVYQWKNISGVDGWSPVVKLSPDFHSTSQVVTFASGVSPEIQIKTSEIGYIDKAASLSTLLDSKYWFNVQVTLSNYDVDAVTETHYPSAVSVKIEDVKTNGSSENVLPITLYAKYHDGTSWVDLGHRVIAHIMVSVVDATVITEELGS